MFSQCSLCSSGCGDNLLQVALVSYLLNVMCFGDLYLVQYVPMSNVFLYYISTSPSLTRFAMVISWFQDVVRQLTNCGGSAENTRSRKYQKMPIHPDATVLEVETPSTNLRQIQSQEPTCPSSNYQQAFGIVGDAVPCRNAVHQKNAAKILSAIIETELVFDRIPLTKLRHPNVPNSSKIKSTLYRSIPRRFDHTLAVRIELT